VATATASSSLSQPSAHPAIVPVVSQTVAAPVLASSPEAAPVVATSEPASKMQPVVAAPSVAASVATSVEQPAAPLPTGVVKLAISPWGEVFEGDRSLGVTPPLTQLKLPVGRHTLIIRNGDAKPLRKTVDVKAGVAVNIDHQF
jgi:serine/threonine-protein kinase